MKQFTVVSKNEMFFLTREETKELMKQMYTSHLLEVMTHNMGEDRALSKLISMFEDSDQFGNGISRLPVWLSIRKEKVHEILVEMKGNQ